MEDTGDGVVSINSVWNHQRTNEALRKNKASLFRFSGSPENSLSRREGREEAVTSEVD